MTADPYPLLQGRHPDPERVPTHLAPGLALALLAEDLFNNPDQVTPTDLDTALELIPRGQRARRYAEYVLIQHARTTGLTMEQIAPRLGVLSAASLGRRLYRTVIDLSLTPTDLLPATTNDALVVATTHLQATSAPRLMVSLAAPLLAVWLLHRPRPTPLTWFTTPTTPPDLNPDDHTVALNALQEHTDLPPGTQADIVSLIHRTLTRTDHP